jgi:hypothetical protein
MYYILIIIFVIFILYLYINNKYKENFKDDNIHANKDVYVNNEQPFEYDNINANKLCIKDENGTECINKEELFNALELPIFRRHAVCIDDACLTVNNLNKINGDENIKLETTYEADGVKKCINYDHIPAALSVRKQKRWETDANGLKYKDGTIGGAIIDKAAASGERAGTAIASVVLSVFTSGLSLLANIGAKKRAEKRNKVVYHSLYEPKEGWKTTVKDFCRKSLNRSGTLYGRRSKNNWRCRVPGKSKGRWGKGTYGFCQKGYGYYDYDNIDKYGCSAGHRSGAGMCIKSAGKQCSDARRQRERKYRGKKGNKKYQFIGSNIISDDPEIEDGIPVIDSVNCDEEKTHFKIDSGELKKNIPFIDKPLNYFISNKFPHESHNKIR